MSIKCSVCKQEKEADEFFWRNKLKGKRHSQCKECYKVRTDRKSHYRKNKQEYIDRAVVRNRKNRKKIQDKFLEYMSDKCCIECGESDVVVLEFHHPDSKKKERSVSYLMRGFSWERVLEEIEKCEILCANCHKRKTAVQFGWFRC